MIVVIERENINLLKKYKTNLNIDLNFNLNPFFKCIIYILNDTITGYISYEHKYDMVEIDNIEVQENSRNQGIGSEMLEFLISMCKKNNIVNITLEVNKNNTAAINLYKKYDFKMVAIRKKYYNGVDGILMKREF